MDYLDVLIFKQELVKVALNDPEVTYEQFERLIDANMQEFVQLAPEAKVELNRRLVSRDS